MATAISTVQNQATAAYSAIVAEAERIGWPLHYREDLYVHDKATLFTADQVKRADGFIWQLRDCGTYLWPCTFEHSVGWAEACANTWPAGLWYIWNGRTLKAASAEDAIAWLRRHAIPQVKEGR